MEERYYGDDGEEDAENDKEVDDTRGMTGEQNLEHSDDELLHFSQNACEMDAKEEQIRSRIETLENEAVQVSKKSGMS